jgi:Putative peptidoglycan binding domain
MIYPLYQFKTVLHGLGFNLGPYGYGSNYNNVLDEYTMAAIQEFQAHYYLKKTGVLDLPTIKQAHQCMGTLKQNLNLILDKQIPLNGFYGPCTIQGVINFQKQYGLPATGIASSVVRKKLNTVAKEKLHLSIISPSIDLLQSA